MNYFSSTRIGTVTGSFCSNWQVQFEPLYTTTFNSRSTNFGLTVFHYQNLNKSSIFFSTCLFWPLYGKLCGYRTELKFSSIMLWFSSGFAFTFWMIISARQIFVSTAFVESTAMILYFSSASSVKSMLSPPVLILEFSRRLQYHHHFLWSHIKDMNVTYFNIILNYNIEFFV